MRENAGGGGFHLPTRCRTPARSSYWRNRRQVTMNNAARMRQRPHREFSEWAPRMKSQTESSAWPTWEGGQVYKSNAIQAICDLAYTVSPTDTPTLPIGCGVSCLRTRVCPPVGSSKDTSTERARRAKMAEPGQAICSRTDSRATGGRWASTGR